MGLLSEYAEVGVSSKDYKRYEELGYEIPKHYNTRGRLALNIGEKITVKVSDLSHGSNAIVDVECDNCKKQYKKKYCNYCECIKYHDGFYCANCASIIFNSGKNSGSWNPNKTEEERILGRCYPEYTDFVKRVQKRDNYTCQRCGKHRSKDCKIKVHHLDGYSWCIEKRTEVINGITLCETCHGNFHYIYGRTHNTKEQFLEWMNDYVLNLDDYTGVVSTARQIYCVEEDKIYYSAFQLAALWHVKPASVYAVCNREIKYNKRLKKSGEVQISPSTHRTLKNKHLIWLDEYIQMSEEELYAILNEKKESGAPKRKVICLTTKEVFNSVTSARKYYGNGKKLDISSCCQGKNKTSGKLPDGTPLQWAYYEDYIKQNNLTEEEALASLIFIGDAA